MSLAVKGLGGRKVETAHYVPCIFQSWILLTRASTAMEIICFIPRNVAPPALVMLLLLMVSESWPGAIFPKL